MHTLSMTNAANALAALPLAAFNNGGRATAEINGKRCAYDLGSARFTVGTCSTKSRARAVALLTK